MGNLSKSSFRIPESLELIDADWYFPVSLSVLDKVLFKGRSVVSGIELAQFIAQNSNFSMDHFVDEERVSK